MELSILDTVGLPEGSILSVRCGPTRRQSPLPCTVPFRLSVGPLLRIDVLSLLGKSGASATLSKLDAEGRCKVPLETRDGRKMSVTLQVYDEKSGRPKPSADAVVRKEEAVDGSSPVIRKRDSEAEARSYLDRHRLHEFMHALFDLLLRERPDDPYAFIAARFQEAALLEPRSAPDLPSIQKGEKIHSSIISTATTHAPTAKSDEGTLVIPEGSMQVVVRNMRGRALSRLVHKPEDTVRAVKEKLASSLGVPVSSQHLLWWGETLPNDTTLAEHSMPSAGVSLHLAYGTRDPRLKYALSGSSDGGLRLWSLRDGELVRDFKSGGPAVVLALAVHWESMRAVAGCFNGQLQFWDLNTGLCIRSIEAHKEEIQCVEVDWPTMRVLTGASDASSKLWNFASEKADLVRTLPAGSTVYSLSVDWQKMRACGGLRSGCVRLWDLESGVTIEDFSHGVVTAKASNSAVSSTAMDCVGMRAVSGLEDGHLVYWFFGKVEDRKAGEDAPGGDGEDKTPKPKVLLAHYCAIRTIVAHWRVEGGSRALCGSDDGSLSLWRVDSHECMARFARHPGYVWTLSADWARGRALSGAFDGCFKLWDLRTGECLRTVQSHTRPVRSIAGGGSN